MVSAQRVSTARFYRRTAWTTAVSTACGALALALGVAVLAAWWFGIEPLVQPLPTYPEMDPNTASWLLLLGSAQLLLRNHAAAGFKRRLATTLAIVVCGLAVMTLAEYAVDADLKIDRLFVHIPLNTTTGYPSGRSAPETALVFLILAAAVAAIDVRIADRVYVTEALSTLAWLIAVLALAGYVYGDTALYRGPIPRTGIAPHTIVGMFALSLGLLCLRPDRPMMRLFTSSLAGGFVVRRLLVGALAIPGIGLLAMVGSGASLYEQPFAAALLAVSAMAIALILVFFTGRALDRLDAARTESERHVAESEERLRYLIDHASDGIFIADLDGRYVEVNDAACTLLGHRREEIIGKTIVSFIPPEDVPRLDASKHEMLQHGASHIDEWKMKKADGNYVPVEVSAKILLDGRWQALVRDISARKHVDRASAAAIEAVTQTAEASVRTVLQTIALQAQLATDAEFVAIGIGGDAERPFDPWVFVGMPRDRAAAIGRLPRAAGLFGLVRTQNGVVRLADLTTHPAFRGFPPNHPRMTSFLGTTIRSRGRPIGSLFLTNKRGAPEFTDHDERIVEQLAVRVGTIIETATLYQAEGLERAWLESVIDQMPDGVLLNDINGVTRAENRMLQDFACTTNQVDPWGQPVRYDLRLPNDEPVAIDDQPHIRAVIDGTATPPTEFVLCHSDGRRIPMLVSASPVFDVYGHRSGAVTIYRDISAIKELQRLREEWTSVVAHDLRQPVGVIAMDASMLDMRLQRGQLDECRKSVARIQRSATHLDAMIHDLLDASVIDAGRLLLNRKATELVSWLEEAVDRVAVLASGHHVRIERQARDVHAAVDQLRLERVMSNLISNAAKYGEPGKDIVVTVARHDSMLEIAVTNHGRGIPPAELPKVFDRFVRTEATRATRVEGLGLGLYISRGIVEAHGGQIWAESTPDDTTSFHFTIPVVVTASSDASLPEVTVAKHRSA
jgi:PAS domain S-box-containing protein